MITAERIDPKDLNGLLEHLRVTEGYLIGVDQYLALQDLLVSLRLNHAFPKKATDLGPLIAPIICKTPHQQREFPHHFNEALKSIKPREISPPPDAGLRKKSGSTPHFSWLRVLTALGFCLFTIFVAFVLFNKWNPFLVWGVVVDITGKPITGADVNIGGYTTKSTNDGSWTIDGNSIWPTQFTVKAKGYSSFGRFFYKKPEGYIEIELQSLENTSERPIETTNASINDLLIDNGVSRKEQLELANAVTFVNNLEILNPLTLWQDFYRRYFSFFQFCAVTLPILCFLIWFRIDRKRRKCILERGSVQALPNSKPLRVKGNTRPLRDGDRLRRLFRRMGYRRKLEARVLDGQASALATIQEMGVFTEVKAVHTITPEYLVLVEHSDPGDQNTQSVNHLLDQLEDGGVLLRRFYFQRNIRRLMDDNGFYSIEQLKPYTQNHRLLIFTNGNVLFNPSSGHFLEWVGDLDFWKERVILTPVGVAQWGYQEYKVIRKGFKILPATQSGLLVMMDLLQGERPSVELSSTLGPFPNSLEISWQSWLISAPQPKEVTETLFKELRVFLSDDGFFWLQSCAIYPEINDHLTLYLGANLHDANGNSLLTEERLLALNQLPWFRHRTMPDWLRMAMIGDLTASQESRIRGILKHMLETASEEPGVGFNLDISQERFLWPVKVPKRSPLRDSVLLRMLVGKASGLSLEVPHLLKLLLFKQGNPYFGLRGSICLMLCIQVAFLLNWFLPEPMARPMELPKFEMVPVNEERPIGLEKSLALARSRQPLNELIAAAGLGNTPHAYQAWLLDKLRELDSDLVPYIPAHEVEDFMFYRAISFNPSGKKALMYKSGMLPQSGPNQAYPSAIMDLDSRKITELKLNQTNDSPLDPEYVYFFYSDNEVVLVDPDNTSLSFWNIITDEVAVKKFPEKPLSWDVSRGVIAWNTPKAVWVGDFENIRKYGPFDFLDSEQVRLLKNNPNLVVFPRDQSPVILNYQTGERRLTNVRSDEFLLEFVGDELLTFSNRNASTGHYIHYSSDSNIWNPIETLNERLATREQAWLRFLALDLGSEVETGPDLISNDVDFKLEWKHISVDGSFIFLIRNSASVLCSLSDWSKPIYLTKLVPPDGNISVKDKPNDIFVFSAQATGTPRFVYEWDFGDGFLPKQSGNTIEHTFQPGQHDVSCRISNSAGNKVISISLNIENDSSYSLALSSDHLNRSETIHSGILLADFNPKHPAFAPHNVSLTAVGTILINDFEQIYQYDLNGNKLETIKLPEGGQAYNMGYLPKQDQLDGDDYVVVGAREEGVAKTILYRRNGEHLGSILLPNGKKGMAHQILFQDGQTFLNVWEKSFYENPKPVLQSVALDHNDDQGYFFRALEMPFHEEMARSRHYRANFKLRWFVNHPDKKTRYVVDQMNPEVWVHKKIGDNERSAYERVGNLSLTLEDRIPDGTVNEYENLDRWFHSFSRITGLFELGDGDYLLSYDVPNEEHAAICGINESGDLSKEIPPFNLYMQRLTSDFKPHGSPVIMEGAFILGVYRDNVFVFHGVPIDGDYWVESLDSSAF